MLKQYPDMYITNVDLKDAPESYEGSIAPQIMFDRLEKIKHLTALLEKVFIKNKCFCLNIYRIVAIGDQVTVAFLNIIY